MAEEFLKLVSGATTRTSTDFPHYAYKWASLIESLVESEIRSRNLAGLDPSTIMRLQQKYAQQLQETLRNDLTVPKYTMLVVRHERFHLAPSSASQDIHTKSEGRFATEDLILPMMVLTWVPYTTHLPDAIAAILHTALVTCTHVDMRCLAVSMTINYILNAILHMRDWPRDKAYRANLVSSTIGALKNARSFLVNSDEKHVQKFDQIRRDALQGRVAIMDNEDEPDTALWKCLEVALIFVYNQVEQLRIRVPNDHFVWKVYSYFNSSTRNAEQKKPDSAPDLSEYITFDQ